MARRRWNTETIQQVLDGDKPFIQVGYTGPSKLRKNGDVWTDGKGIKWKMENGAIIRVNEQADSIRDLVKRKCKCGFDIDMLGSRMDEKIYAKTGLCYDCTILRDTEMMINREFQKFSDKKISQNRLSLAKEFRKNIIETIEYLKKDDSKIEMVHANGEITTWIGSQNEKLLKEAEEDLKKVDKLIEELEAIKVN
jgi:hypothetical protein